MKWARLIAWTFEYGHRAVCGGGIVGDLLGVLELEAVVEVVRVGLRTGIDGVVGVGHGLTPVSRGTTGCEKERWLTDIQCN